jgi:hypothetical protein
MIPQNNFIIIAKVKPYCLDALRLLLKELTFKDRPGIADPANPLIPFGEYGTIHFARLVVLEDNTLSDRVDFGLLPLDEPIYLCFMVDCDGPADELLACMARRPDGLRKIFRHCEDFNAAADLLGWLRAHRVEPTASYVNWVGRSVIQTLEEARLHDLLRNALPGIHNNDPQFIFSYLKSIVKPGMLTAPSRTPLIWRVRKLLNMLLPLAAAAACLAGIVGGLIFFPLIIIATIALLLLGLVAFVIVLRRHEQTVAIVPQPYDPKWVARLREGEDHDVTNQYTAMGSIKPGLFRLSTEWVILYGIDWVARHIFTRGSIGRIGTIHFAHWVFLDQRRRGFFCSNYDGGHEPYMDDFINKAGFGLNLSFSSFIGYPTTNWLVARGAWLEQDFKRFQRHHQIPTDVWYKAYPGLTARDLARNSRIRNGVEKIAMSDDEIRRWLAEI